MFVRLLVVAGDRNHNNGTINNAGSNGNYWSSTVDGTRSRNLNFNGSNANMNSNNRANGFSVRCFKDWLESLLLYGGRDFFYCWEQSMEISFGKRFAAGFLSGLLVLAGSEIALASFVIHSQDTVNLEVKGYSGLTETTLFKGSLTAGGQQEIDTPYQGLALLVFDKGQQYPIILREQSFILKITEPDNPPFFTGTPENAFFYKLLTGKEPGSAQFDFPLLMFKAKQLLQESSSIHTVADLTAMKERFHAFVSIHFQDLQHSDMLRRLMGRYFMMHEYVDFHLKGAPAGDIQVQYKKAVIGGVDNWIRILKPYIPEPEVFNYCVSLYYNRSMVTLAHLIVSSFSDYAYCPGNILKNIQIPEDVSVFDAEGNKKGVVKDFSDNGILAFVSANCPVSMVETVIRARELAGQGKSTAVIVVPVQKISDEHWTMRRMLTSGNMFVDIAASKL